MFIQVFNLKGFKYGCLLIPCNIDWLQKNKAGYKLWITRQAVDTVDNNNLWITLDLSTSETITCGQCEQYCLNYQHGILYRQ
jgi:hypothetical protein